MFFFLLEAHEDIIRGFALLSSDEIVTCSNDGFAKVWHLKEKTLQATYQLHDSFIFRKSNYYFFFFSNYSFFFFLDICVVENKTKENSFQYLISSSEDATCRIWDTNKKPWTLLQILHHPCTVWGVRFNLKEKFGITIYSFHFSRLVFSYKMI
jgi:WD40 repeat protein